MTTETRKGSGISTRNFIIWAVIVVIAVTMMQIWGCGDDQSQGANSSTPAFKVTGTKYVVQRGDYIDKIAAKLNVSPSEMVLVNRAMLQQKFDETCGKFSVSYTNNSRRDGLFCNERFKDPFKNTLRAGWALDIPESQPQAPASAQVQTAVETHTKRGDKVSIVIDATGSMSEDREIAAQLYMAALRKHGRNIQSVYLYRDGKVWSLSSPDATTIREEVGNTGGEENTYEALLKATKDGSDAIILITDEPGDDWPWDRNQRLAHVQPVIATCLSDYGQYGCETNLRRIATETGGQYVAYKQ